MVATPGPDFRWGVLLRRSKYNREIGANGEVILFEESTDIQELELVWHLREQNMGVIVEVYKDIASGWKPGAPRPRFKHALVDLAAGKIDGIAVLNIDRLTRQIGQVRPILNALEEMGGRLFSLQDELDTADDNPDINTELRLHELVTRAEREARRTSERMKTVARHRARKGLPHRGGNRPFGHSPEWDAVFPEEAKLINEAAKVILSGEESCYSIAKLWTKMEVPTITGGPWHHCTVRNILVSPRIVGKRRGSDGILYDLPDVPPILPVVLWERLCEKLAHKPSKSGRRASKEASGIAVCSVCGLPLVGGMEDNGASTYECRKRPNVPGACGGISMRTLAFEAILDKEVVEFINNKARVGTILEQYKMDTPEQAAIDVRYAELEENKLTLDKAAFNPPQGQQRLPLDRYWALREEIISEQEGLSRRRLVNREAEPLRALLREETPYTVPEWRGQPIHWRRTILKLVCARIEVAPDPLRGGGRKGHKGGYSNPERVRVQFADEEE